MKPEIILGNSGSANRYPNNPYPKFLQATVQVRKRPWATAHWPVATIHTVTPAARPAQAHQRTPPQTLGVTVSGRHTHTQTRTRRRRLLPDQRYRRSSLPESRRRQAPAPPPASSRIQLHVQPHCRSQAASSQGSTSSRSSQHQQAPRPATARARRGSWTPSRPPRRSATPSRTRLPLPHALTSNPP